MVCLATLNQFRDYKRENEERFYKEHRGETCLLEFGKNGNITETFFSNGDEAQAATNKYDNQKGKFGTLPYSVVGIPKHTHKFDEGVILDVSFQEGILPSGAKSLDDIVLKGEKKTFKVKPMYQFRPNEYVKRCIHDKKTELKGLGITGGSNGYIEKAECPDCGYTVDRKPLKRDIKRVEKNSSKIIFGSGITPMEALIKTLSQ